MDGMAAEKSSVFVRNLPYDISDPELEDHFAAIGPVTRAFVVRDKRTREGRGFGFVSFVLPDDARRAAAELHGKLVKGRKITVDLEKSRNEAQEVAAAKGKKKPPPPRSDGGGTHVAESTDRVGASARPTEAQVSSTATKAPSGSSGAAAKTAGSDGAAAGAPQPRKKPPAQAVKTERHRLIVRNLSFKCDEAALRAAFEPHGEVKEAHIPMRADGKHPGFGFVEMESANAMQRAIAGVNMQSIKGRIVAVDCALNRTAYARAGATDESSAAAGSSKGAQGGGVAEEEDGEVGVDEEDVVGADDDDDDDDDDDVDDDGDDDDEEEEEDGDDNDEAVSDGESAEELAEEEDEGEDDDDAESDDGSDEEKEVEAAARSKKASAAPVPTVTAEQEAATAEQQKLEATLFVQAVPIEASEADLAKRFVRFGPLRYCRIVKDPVTSISRGTAFVCYVEPASAKAALASPGVLVGGHTLNLSAALDKKRAESAAEERKEKAKAKDTSKRNIHLARLGLTLSGDPGAEALSAAELQRRELAWKQKKDKLANPNFVVSQTRLSIRNIPTQVNEKILKQLALDALEAKEANASGKKSQQRKDAEKGAGNGAANGAGKGGGKGGGKGALFSKIVKHAKIVRDEARRDVRGEPRSKGFGFLEMETHEQALTVLKALSDNADALNEHGSPGRRLLVEFAVDSMAKLRIHEMRRQVGLQQQRRREGGAQRKGASKGNGQQEEVVANSQQGGRQQQQKQPRPQQQQQQQQQQQSKRSRGGESQPTESKKARANKIVSGSAAEWPTSLPAAAFSGQQKYGLGSKANPYAQRFVKRDAPPSFEGNAVAQTAASAHKVRAGVGNDRGKTGVGNGAAPQGATVSAGATSTRQRGGVREKTEKRGKADKTQPPSLAKLVRKRGRGKDAGEERLERLVSEYRQSLSGTGKTGGKFSSRLSEWTQ